MSRNIKTSTIDRPRMQLGQCGTVTDVAVRLGVSPQYIYKCLSDGSAEIDSVAQFGNAELFDVREFEKWYKAKRLSSSRRRANHEYKGVV